MIPILGFNELSASLSFAKAVSNYDIYNVYSEMTLVLIVVTIMIISCLISWYSIVLCNMVFRDLSKQF